MQKVSELVSSSIGDTLTNIKTWKNVMYNVLENGLLGDGVTDDTASLQTLINTAIAAGRKNIFFPHTDTGGQYFVTALTNDNQVEFIGDNASFVGGYSGIISDLGSIANKVSKSGDTMTGDLDMNNHALSNLAKLNIKGQAGLTIESDAITVTQTYHAIDTEGGAANDDLSTINGGAVNDILIIRPADSSRKITIRPQVGNIYSTDNAPIPLYSSASLLTLVKFGGNSWAVVGGSGWNRNNNPATFAASGQQQFDSGFIVKWGLVTGVAHGDKITFPTAFPTACRLALGEVSSNGPAAVGITGLSTTGFNVSFSDSSTGRAVYYIAVGN